MPADAFKRCWSETLGGQSLEAFGLSRVVFVNIDRENAAADNADVASGISV